MASDISYKVVPQDSWALGRIIQWVRDLGRRTRVNTFTWDPPNVPAQSTVDTTLLSTDAGCDSLAEIRAGMVVTLAPPDGWLAGLAIAGVWSASDKAMTIRLANPTAAGVNALAGTWTFHAFSPS